MQSEKITNSKVQTPQSNSHSWGVRNKNSILGTQPAQSTSAGVGRSQKSPVQPNPWTCPTLTPRKEPAHTPGEHAGTPVTCCSMNPNKALLEILIWPRLNFYWLKSPRTQICNITMFTPFLPALGRIGGVAVWPRSNPINMWVVIVSLFVWFPN